MNQGGTVRFVADDRLAICTFDSVEVYQVTRDETFQPYTLMCDEWKYYSIPWPWDVAPIETSPESMFVITWSDNYVYKFPCHEASHCVDKYQINGPNLLCIAANANIVVIGKHEKLMICKLPEMTPKMTVKLKIVPLDLSITADYLLVMGFNEIVMKQLGSLDQNLCSIRPLLGWEFRAACFTTGTREIYAACYNQEQGKGEVQKYVWDGNGVPHWTSIGHVIHDLGVVRNRGLSVTSDGSLLAVCDYGLGTTSIYRHVNATSS